MILTKLIRNILYPNPDSAIMSTEEVEDLSNGHSRENVFNGNIFYLNPLRILGIFIATRVLFEVLDYNEGMQFNGFPILRLC